MSLAQKGHRNYLPVNYIGWNKGKTGIYSKETIDKIREARLRQVLPKKDTIIEVAIQKGLDYLGIHYEKHLPVCDICQPDIVFPEKKVAIFCDGNYWHNRPKAKEKDMKQNEILIENHWKILRLWEHEINEDLNDCINRILEIL